MVGTAGTAAATASAMGWVMASTMAEVSLTPALLVMAWVVVSMAVAGTARPKTAETEGAGSRRPFSSGLVKPARLERDVKRAHVGCRAGA
jgi:hypothetical protein